VREEPSDRVINIICVRDETRFREESHLSRLPRNAARLCERAIFAKRERTIRSAFPGIPRLAREQRGTRRAVLWPPVTRVLGFRDAPGDQ